MAKKLVYPATFTQDGEYIFVEFPDVDGAFTQGENLQEAYEMAEEVLGIILADNKEYPIPSTVKEIATRYPKVSCRVKRKIRLRDYKASRNAKRRRK